MNAKQRQTILPAQEMQYVQIAGGEYVLYSTKYTAKDGTVVGPKYQSDFGNSIGLLDMQICLLNLKLCVDGLANETHPTHHLVMEGDQAGFFATTLAQIRKTSDSQWYAALFGNTGPFFSVMRAVTPRTIGVPKTHPDMPRSIKVGLLHGIADSANRLEAVTAKADIENIIMSLQRQAQVRRAVRQSRPAQPAALIAA